MLTKRQHELLAFLVDYQTRNALSPSYEEICRALKLRSKSAVHGLVNGLEKRGYCKRFPNRARAIEILKTVDSDMAALGTLSPSSSSSDVQVIPFFGILGSVGSLSTMDMPQRTVNVLKEFLPEGDLKAFEVQGDFLKDWGILNGDQVIFQATTEGMHDMVMLVSIDQKLMLRKWVNEGHRVTLKTANRYMIPEIHFKEQVKVHGKMVFLWRSIKYPLS